MNDSLTGKIGRTIWNWQIILFEDFGCSGNGVPIGDSVSTHSGGEAINGRSYVSLVAMDTV